MNGAQLHLMLNHLPSVGVIAGLMTLLVGWLSGMDGVRKTGAWIILIAGITVWPASFTGEQAEEVVEHLPGFQRNLIHEHEEAAGTAFVVTLISAALALIYLVGAKGQKAWTKFVLPVLVLSCVAGLALVMNASHLGGLIRHPELQNGSAVASPQNNGGGGEEHDH